MDYQKTATEIVAAVGGKENVISVIHCMTRLRFVLNDEQLVETEKIKKIDGVMGVAKSGGQYQIIIGPQVSNLYPKVTSLLEINSSDLVANENHSKEKDMNLFNRFFKMIVGIIAPVMGVMAAAGIVKGLLAAATSFHILATTDGTYQILYAFSDGFFYFMPIILGFSAAQKFKSNPYIGATIGTALLYSNIVTLNNEGAKITFLKIPVILTSYGSTVFPIIAAVALAALIEKKVDPKMPAPVKLFGAPTITLLITVPLTFLIIGPIMVKLSDLLAASTQAIYHFSPILTGLVLGAFWQVIVIFGLHYAFIPILINNIATAGEDPINAILGMTVFALAGAALGFAFKQKNEAARALGISTGITGLFGITEPIIYGVALPYKKPFIAAFIGGGLGGIIIAMMKVKTYGFGGNGLFSPPIYINPKGIDSGFTAFVIAAAVSFFVSLIISYITTDKNQVIS